MRVWSRGDGVLQSVVLPLTGEVKLKIKGINVMNIPLVLSYSTHARAKVCNSAFARKRYAALLRKAT